MIDKCSISEAEAYKAINEISKEWERKMVACKKNNTEGMELAAKMGDVLNRGLDLINKKA